jgi:hypothetical protein
MTTTNPNTPGEPLGRQPNPSDLLGRRPDSTDLLGRQAGSSDLLGRRPNLGQAIPMPTNLPTAATIRPDSLTRVPNRTRLRRALTVLTAVLTAAVGWAIAGPLADVELAVRSGAAGKIQHIGLPAVIFVSLVAGLAGWALLAGLERLTRRARAAWTVCAVAALIVSLAGPLAALTATASIVLVCLHLLVAGVLITGLRRSARRR